MLYWRKMVFYKNFLMVIFTANIFMLFSGMFLSYNYWSEIKSFENERHEVNLMIESEIESLARIEKAWSLLGQNKKLQEGDKVRALAEWELLKKSGYKNVAISTPLPSTKDIRAVHSESVLRLTELQAKSKANTAVRSNKKTQLIIISALTVVLGMFLPMVLGYLLSNSILKVREKAEQTVSQVVAEWAKANSQGKSAFQNPEFWAKAIIISLREWFDGVSTPMGRYAVQISQLVESEMKKVNETPQIPPDDNSHSIDRVA